MCTSIAVGQEASVDGSLLVARNEDCTCASRNKAMIRRLQPEWVAFPNSVALGMWTLGNGMQVPASSYAYISMPDVGAAEEATAAIGNRFLFEERGVNSCYFDISATNSMTSNEVLHYLWHRPNCDACPDFIEADNLRIGLMCFVGIGMAEVSTCDITVYEGAACHQRGVTWDVPFRRFNPIPVVPSLRRARFRSGRTNPWAKFRSHSHQCADCPASARRSGPWPLMS